MKDPRATVPSPSGEGEATVPSPSGEGESPSASPTSRSDPRVGKVVGGRYRIEERIGRGGMGIVYRATHLDLGEAVAVKFLLSLYGEVSEVRERFRREAIALARLRHPGIVSILDFGEHEGELFMAMEFLRGRTLADEMRSYGRLPIVRLGPIFAEILEVLEAAHREGMVHRDVKPENVMLAGSPDRVDRVKLLDFGLVHLRDPPAGERGEPAPRLTETGSVRGTPTYMSPEQCRGIVVGPPADVYALGIMLYEALSGIPPFESPDAAVLMAQHIFMDVPTIAERTQNSVTVPPGYEAVSRAALAKRAEDRPTAREMRDALTAAMKGSDPETVAERAAVLRARAAGLTRSDRAITGFPPPMPEAESRPEPSGDRVLFAAVDGGEIASLRRALAVRGLQSVLAGGGTDTIQAAFDGATPPRAIVLSSGGNILSLLASLRVGPTARVPIMVLSATGPEDVARLVRAGASDIALASSSEDEIARRIQRLVRRGR